jgi:DNA-directed RNA polymerase subunit RPC12/RpoP
MQPDGAAAELQRRMGISMFVQGWLPLLDEAGAAMLLTTTGLKAEYVEAEVAQGEASSCGACGAPTVALKGARRIVCEHCGHALDLRGERVRCAGCGASLAPGEGTHPFACPHCRTTVQRVAAWGAR